MVDGFDFQSLLKLLQSEITCDDGEDDDDRASDKKPSKGKKNPYPRENRDKTNPFHFLYESNDCELAKDDNAISNIYDSLIELEDLIKGDWMSDREYYRQKIKENDLSYIINGAIYTKDKVMCTYRALGYKNFKNYCQDIYGVCHSNVYKYQMASRVATELMIAGFETLPKNVDQAYALKDYTGLELIKIWGLIVKIYPLHQITKKTILEAIGKDKPYTQSVDRRIVLLLYVHQFIEKVADSWKVNISTVIEELIRFVIYIFLPHQIEDSTPEDKDKNWQDMSDLTSQYEEFLANGGDDFLGIDL